MSIAALPLDWDTDSLFPSLDSPKFASACAELTKAIERFATTLEAAERRGGAESVADVITAQNEIIEQNRLIGAFIAALVTTNSRNDAARAAESELDMRMLPFEKLTTRVAAWIGTLDLDALIPQSSLLREHEFALRKIHVASQHLMSPAEEELASDLSLSGISAWQKLQGNVSSQLIVNVDLPDGPKAVPMSLVRTMAYDPNRDIRQAAYQAELDAWKANEVPIAAAMNSIKGATEVLTKRRGWDSALDMALFNANIDRETLDAMMKAAHESFPDFRRYLNAKARALGIDKLAFYDIFAPLTGEGRSWSYEDGAAFVSRQFRGYSDKLGDFADRAFGQAWVDVYPKPGKRDGAFCMSVQKEVSRILMNFKPSFGSVSTLAHELGHGYHNLCLSDRTGLQRRTPMTLAETASIFCETIIRQAGMAEADAGERLTILEASLQGSCQVVVDITSRFLFESTVFERRAAREMSAAELCEAMLHAQRQTYGEGLDTELLHPYMWAAKPHYYGGRSFYNFPYMFGLLFGLGLYSVYQREPTGFHERYDDLLSSTGLADAATLGQRFGIDIRSADFWRGSLAQVRADIDEFERLTN